MELFAIETGYFKLGGGAMFGAVPKTIWNRNYPADENNLNRWAMRSMLIKKDNRLILIDTGIGDKQSEKFFSFLYLHGEDSLQKSIEKLGFKCEDITDVILTHLHFDHVGGAVCIKDNQLSLSFPKATYWSNEIQWESAVHPNKKEAPSFIKDDFIPLQTSGQLKFIPCTDSDYPFIHGLNIRFVHGHTLGMMLPIISIENQTFVYCADLIPTIHHLSLSYIIAYDIQPLETIKERSRLIEEALKNDYVLILEHDVEHTCIKLMRNDNGKIQAIPYFLK